MADDDPIRWLREVCEAGTPGPGQKRIGPCVRMQCFGCRYHEQSRYVCQGDSGYDHRCLHPDGPKGTFEPADTPATCPVNGPSALGTLREPLLTGALLLLRRVDNEAATGSEIEWAAAFRDAIRTHRGDDRE